MSPYFNSMIEAFGRSLEHNWLPRLRNQIHEGLE